ncbi:MAG: hypothetical protein ABUT20_45275, partial [Bacteroidota bacterium]
MFKRIFLLISASLALISIHAQIKWPAITQQTKPWTRWWWMGSAVDEKGISSQITEMSKVGF